MIESIAEFKRQLAGFLSLYDFGEIDKIWRDRDEWHGLESEEWVDAVLWIEDCQLFMLINGYSEGWEETYEQFEQLVRKCGLHWEMQNQCVVYLGDCEKLDAICARKQGDKSWQE